MFFKLKRKLSRNKDLEAFLFCFTAEDMQLVCDFRQVMQKVVWLRLTECDETLDQVFDSFLSYYEQSELFDLHTHGTGPGLLGVVIHSLKMYLGRLVDTKLYRHLPVEINRKCSLDIYVNKLKEICSKVVCDKGDEGTNDHGRLKKVVEDGAKATKSKKKNVNYTEWKATATTSKSVSSEEDSGNESCSTGEDQFTTLTSYDGHEQYKPPDKMRREPRFGAKRRDQDCGHDPMRSLKEEFSKVTKKLSKQERTIKSLKLSNAVQKQKLTELGDGAGAVTATKKKGMPKQGSFGSKPLRDHDEWALTGDRGFMPAETSNLKGFISTQFREELEGTEPILVIDDPDSTTGGTKKKKKKASRKIEEIDKEFNMLQKYCCGHKDQK